MDMETKERTKRPASVYSKKIIEMRRICKIAFDKGLIDTHSGNISVGAGSDILITKTGASLVDLQLSDFTAVPFKYENRYDLIYSRARGGQFNLKRTQTADKVSSNALNVNEASSELKIHEFILNSFPEATVFHAHPLNAIALSLKTCNDGSGNKLESAASPPLSFGSPALAPPLFPLPSSFKKLYSQYPDLDIIRPVDFESAYFFPEIYIFPLSFITDIKSGNLKLKLKAKDIFKENGVFMIKSHGSFSWGKTPLDALRWTIMLEASSEIILKSSRSSP